MCKLSTSIKWLNHNINLDVSGCTADEINQLIQNLNAIEEEMLKQDLEVVPDFNDDSVD